MSLSVAPVAVQGKVFERSVGSRVCVTLNELSLDQLTILIEGVLQMNTVRRTSCDKITILAKSGVCLSETTQSWSK